MSNDTQHCPDCGEHKSPAEFPRNKGTRSGLNTYCRTCSNLRAKAWREANHARSRANVDAWHAANREANRPKRRNREYARTYGITLAEYEAKLIGQGGGCAICGRLNANGKNLSVDHCHVTGQARGLLCQNCNAGIGMLGDNATTVGAALAYLLAHQ